MASHRQILRGLVGCSTATLFSATLWAQQPGRPEPAQGTDRPPSRSVTIYPADVTIEVPPAAASAVSPARLDALNSGISLDNKAGVTVDLIPGVQVPAGAKLGFRVTTKKPGYLILVDVDASGRLTQIFPNTATIGEAARNAPNLVRPGRALTIPQFGTPYAAFEFVADPPSGLAMVVALLSDKPVEVVDLPGTQPPATAPYDTLQYVRDQARKLKVSSAGDNSLEQPSWSFDGKFYLIK
jgi:hypothetical protein